MPLITTSRRRVTKWRWLSLNRCKRHSPTLVVTRKSALHAMHMRSVCPDCACGRSSGIPIWCFTSSRRITSTFGGCSTATGIFRRGCKKKGRGRGRDCPPAPKRVLPCSGHVLSERVQAASIGRYAVLVEGTLDKSPQSTADHGERLVHTALQCLKQVGNHGTMVQDADAVGGSDQLKLAAGNPDHVSAFGISNPRPSTPMNRLPCSVVGRA